VSATVTAIEPTFPDYSSPDKGLPSDIGALLGAGVSAVLGRRGWRVAAPVLGERPSAAGMATAANRRESRWLSRARARACRLGGAGLASSIDFFGENISDPIQADRVTEHYVALAQRLEQARENTFLSIDLSHIGLEQPGEAVQQRLERIAAALPAGRRIQVGAEQERRADRILAAVWAVARTGGAVSATIQANLKRSPADAQALAEGGVPIRLVKGAYMENPRVARPWGEPTDLAFLELAHELHANGAEVAIATHDAILREALLRALPGIGVEMLLGVRSADARVLAGRGVPVRIYVPYGDGWFRYAMRRWAESVRR
jgi:proline dehydrogenase